VRLTIPGPAGPLEALLDEPALDSESSPAAPAPRAAVVFAHPHPEHGGTMHTKAVYQAAKALTRIGCAALRFNFRGVGSSAGTFDSGAGEMQDFTAALDFMSARYPAVPLWAGGFSFGSWIAMETGAADPRVALLVGIAPPLTREGYSFPNTLATTKPKFFIQGSLDELCPIQDLWAFYAKLHEPKEIAVVDGASHLFEGRTREVGDAIEELLGDYEL
jgi:uncharacterized protein